MLIVLTLLLVTNNLQAQTIVVFGDSLSMGHGVPYNKGWAFILQQHLAKQKPPYRLINASIGGDTTSSGVVRLPQTLARHQPAVVVLELGGNDGLRGLSLEQTRNNLDKMITMIKQKHIRLLLVGIRLPPNYGQDYTKKFHQIYHDLAAKHAVPLLPFMLEGVAGYKALMQQDGIHPNTKAQQLVFENVWKYLQKLLPRKT